MVVEAGIPDSGEALAALDVACLQQRNIDVLISTLMELFANLCRYFEQKGHSSEVVYG